MALWDRVLGDVDPATLTPLTNDAARKGVAVNHLTCALWFWKVEPDAEITRANVINRLGLTPDDEAELDALAAKFNGLNLNQRVQYWLKLQQALLLATARPWQRIPRAKFLALVGL